MVHDIVQATYWSLGNLIPLQNVSKNEGRKVNYSHQPEYNLRGDEKGIF